MEKNRDVHNFVHTLSLRAPASMARPSLREKLSSLHEPATNESSTRLLHSLRQKTESQHPLSLISPKMVTAAGRQSERVQEVGASSSRVSAVKGLLSSLEVDALEADRRRRAVTGSVLRYMEGQHSQWPVEQAKTRKALAKARQPPGCRADIGPKARRSHAAPTRAVKVGRRSCGRSAAAKVRSSAHDHDGMSGLLHARLLHA